MRDWGIGIEIGDILWMVEMDGGDDEMGVPSSIYERIK